MDQEGSRRPRSDRSEADADRGQAPWWVRSRPRRFLL